MGITPFRIEVTDAELADLKSRLFATRWPDQLSGEQWARGVSVEYLKRLAAYWADGFDWRAQEAELNSYPQFRTEIDGQTIHFLHVTSSELHARRLMLLHEHSPTSWPRLAMTGTASRAATMAQS
jgi:epoxide hydrolase